jgi:hypothetical protein
MAMGYCVKRHIMIDIYVGFMKFQVTFPDAFAEEARIVSARLKIPLAQFIRDSMEQRLRELRNQGGGGRRFLERFSGAINTGESDLASRVDEILYGSDPHE